MRNAERSRTAHPHSMYVEAFTQSKNPKAPLRNEDRLVLHADRLFAVIDGVTDKSGETHDGLTGGQLAGQLIETALRELVDTHREFTASAREILDLIDGKFQHEYSRRGLEKRVRDEPTLRFGAQLAALFTDGDRIRILQVGDCGVLIDGQAHSGTSQPGDEILGHVRSHVYQRLRAAGSSSAERLAQARAAIVDGLDSFSTAGTPLSDAAWVELREQLLDELPSAFPQLPAQHVIEAARGGLKQIARHRNTKHPLGHACLDGTTVPDSFISDTTHSWNRLSVIELYSDGYFGRPAHGGSVLAWEQHLAHVEKEDPEKIRTVRSTKGSAPGCFTDDRTILILRKETAQHVPV